MSSQFSQRLWMSVISTLVLFVMIYFSHEPFFKPIFLLFTALFLGASLWEYYRLAEHKGFHPLMSVGIIGSALYIISVYLSLFYTVFESLPELTLLFLLLTFFLFFFNRQTNPLSNLAVTVFGIIYLTIPLSCALKINYFTESTIDGRIWLAYTIIVSKATDAGAYLFGKLLGNIKLAPHISPKKTIEGALGGLLMGVIASLIFYSHLSSTPTTPSSFLLSESIYIGLIIAILSQFGDLSESILKRDAGVKDSNHLPGLGGFLDIVDSLVFTLPFIYLLLKMKWI